MSIPIEQQILGILFSVTLLLVTVQLIRKHQLREEYALVWMGASLAIFLLVLVEPLVGILARLFAVTYAPTLILVFGVLFCVVLLLSQTVTISAQANRIRDLAQYISMLEWRLREVEQKRAAPHEEPAAAPQAGYHVNGRNNGYESGQEKRHDEKSLEAAGIPHQSGHVQSAASGQERQGDATATDAMQTGEAAIKAETEDGSGPPPAEEASAEATAHVQPSGGERPNKVLVLGLDGATFDLIKPWAAAGYLPTLKRIMEQGAHGELRSTVPPMTGPAWTSFATGVNPGKHRLYDWIAREPDSYTFSPMTALDCTAPTLYSLLSDAGRRVCALNIPMTYPPLPINGVMVSGMPAPSTKVTFTYPEQLHREIVEQVGDYILYPDPGQAYSDSGVDAFLDHLYRTTDLRLKTLDYLRGREAWDFAMVVFNGTDTISHAMWKFMDQTHPLHDPEKAMKYGNAIRNYYAYLDAKLARVVDELDDDTTLVVMSDHGFGPFHKFIHVNNWLLQEGFMAAKSGWRTRLKRGLFRQGVTPMNVYDTLMRMGLGALKREVVRGQGQGQSLLKTFFLSFQDIDWRRTQAYSLGNVGQIYLNVAGREPNGCVTPGAEYEEVRSAIIDRLRSLRDPETGELVAEHIYRREELYTGDHLAQAPDIVFLPRRLEYFGFGEYEFGSHRIIESMRRGISGTHRMNGIFMAYGAAIRPGATVTDASLYDLAPTILRLMGEPTPDHMDGRVLEEVIVPDMAASMAQRRAIRAGQVNGGGPSGGQSAGLSDADKKVLAERLRSLGYVG